MKRPTTLLLAVVPALFLATAAPASAATPPPSGPRVLESGMTIVGFDEAVAQANGFEVRVDAQGRQYSVPAGTSPAAVDSPANNPIVTGPCGTSYLYYDAIGYRKANLRTGFGVVYPAVRYGWTVSVVDNIGVGTVSWGGNLFFRRTWEGTRTTAHGTTGFSWAQVTPTSYAILSNGARCTSLSPWDDTNLY